jgi:hypothetical protein
MTVLKGVALGVTNVLVVGIALSIDYRDAAMIPFVALFGGVPGVAVGAALGGVAKLLETRSWQLRLPILAIPAVGLVFALGGLLGATEVIPLASVPTMLSAVVLERWTRRSPAQPPIPVATIQSLRG